MTFRCLLTGHVPVWLDDKPGPDYVCQRCHHGIWFWRGQHTGWYLYPEPPSNAYRGSRLARLIGGGR